MCYGVRQIGRPSLSKPVINPDPLPHEVLRISTRAPLSTASSTSSLLWHLSEGERIDPLHHFHTSVVAQPVIAV